MNSIIWYHNWWVLANAQPTDAEKLAWIQGALDYAFGGVETKVPSNKKPTAKELARYYGFITVQPMIDKCKEKQASAKNGAAVRWSKKRDAEHNAQHNTEDDAEHNAQMKSASCNININSSISSSSGINTHDAVHHASTTAATLKDVENYFYRLSQVKAVKILDDEKKEFLEWLELNEWKTANGVVRKDTIQRTFAAWRSIRRKEQDAAAQNKPGAPVEIEAGYQKITEEDL
jgi:hypothetical protein